MINSKSITIALLGLLVWTGASAGTQPAQDATKIDKSAFFGTDDFGGFVLVSQFIKQPPDRRNLQSICAAKTTAVADALQATEGMLALMPAPGDPLTRVRMHNAAGQVRLYNGDVEAAIAHFEAAYKILQEQTSSMPDLARLMRYTELATGTAYMRMGELENCARNHSAEMCIFPLSPAARHTATSWSERAVEYFEKYLAASPDDREVIWLLNIAYQTLGKYPDKVPKAYLIPPSALASKEDIGRFPDVAPALGLDVVGNAGGAIVDDFDNDGDLDVVSSGVDPCEPMHMFRSNGDGTFEDVSAKSRLAEQLGGLNLVQTDYDNDGWLDIYVIRGGWEFPMRNSLMRNRGDGTFEDVTERAGLMFPEHRTQSAGWADYDNDGWLDLYVGHEMTPSQLFRNKGDGTFEDVSAKAGVDNVGFTKAVVWGDYDNDGFRDIYVSNFTEDNFLYHNKGDGTFEEVATELRVEKPLRSFPTWFFDYDNDGWLDLFVSSYAFGAGEWVRPYLGLPRQWDSMKLYRNTGKGGFVDVTKEVGLDRSVAAMGSNFGDLDNDGYLDFYLGTGTPSFTALMPNLMFRNHDGKYFVDVTTSTGTGQLQKGHGVAFADVDNDGDEDVYANIGGAIPSDEYNKALYENPGHPGNWISLKLVGVKSNRAAIGAKIKVTLVGKNGPAGIRYREVTSGGSFGSSPLAQHIGIGTDTRIASIEITWPASRTRQVFTDVAPNQFLEIKESEKAFTKRKVTAFALGKQQAAPHTHH